MTNKLERIMGRIPLCIYRGASVSLVCLSIGGAIAIGRTDGLEVSKESIRMERQASRNQIELENALGVIDTCQDSLKQVDSKVKQLNKGDKRTKEIVEDLQLVGKVIPQSKVNRIEETIRQSEELLFKDKSTHKKETI